MGSTWHISGDDLYIWLARHLDKAVMLDGAYQDGGVIERMAYKSRRKGLQVYFRPGATPDTVMTFLHALAHVVPVTVRAVYRGVEWTARMSKDRPD